MKATVETSMAGWFDKEKLLALLDRLLNLSGGAVGELGGPPHLAHVVQGAH